MRRTRDVINTTTDSRTYRLANRFYLEAFGRCSRCSTHGGHCNAANNHSRSHSRSKTRYAPRVA